MYLHDFIAHVHVKSRFNPSVDEWVTTFSKELSLIAKRHQYLNQVPFRNIVRRELDKMLNAHDVVYSLWVNTKGERHVNVIITLYNIGKFKIKIEVPSLRTDEAIKEKARYDIGCLIGDLSQDFYECSYNDFDVFVAWKSKDLNAHWERMDEISKEVTLRTGGMAQLFVEYLPGRSYDWEALLDRLYELAQGWPTDWLATYQTLEELSTQAPYKY
jgi:hypothetical protein